MSRHPCWLALIVLAVAATHADAQQLKPRLTLKGHTNKIVALALTADGTTLFTAGADQTVRVWDLATGKEKQVLHCGAPVKALAITPDGKTLVTGGLRQDDQQKGYVGAVQVWDVAAAKVRLTFTKEKHTEFNAVAVTPDGKSVLAVGRRYGTNAYYEGQLFSLNAATGAEQWSAKTPSLCDALALSLDGKTALGAGSEKTELRDVATGKTLRVLEHRGWGRSVAFSPDGKLVAVGGTKEVRLWDVDTGTLRTTLYPGLALGLVRGLAFSPNGKTLAVAGGFGSDRPGELKLYDLGTAQERLTAKCHEAFLTGVTFTADNRTLITVGADHAALVWEIK